MADALTTDRPVLGPLTEHDLSIARGALLLAMHGMGDAVRRRVEAGEEATSEYERGYDQLYADRATAFRNLGIALDEAVRESRRG